MKTCLYCAEQIHNDAKICKHCGKQVNVKDLDKHVKILSMLFFGYGGIKFIIGIVLMNILSMVGKLLESTESIRILSFIGDSIGSILIFSAIPNIIGGFGLYKRQIWARTLGLILCFLSIFSIPFGTAIGIYGIWVLLKDESKEYFI